ncbi:alpha/beta hydrolase domain-containing protein [Saccharopolyspora sp. NPDC002686]|uniref:alpha/beta hydrolase domain-containing protein n=1 Tax=Saccharopolyspora sp. NPDC002686 TaxID=3154541 RepID=UPI0033323E12
MKRFLPKTKRRSLPVAVLGTLTAATLLSTMASAAEPPAAPAAEQAPSTTAGGAPAAAQVPAPTVTGPIPAAMPPGTDLTHNYPQLAAEPGFDLSRRGYVEEEYFFGGNATRYDTPPMADGVALSTGNPYQTRMIVRRPEDPAKFNGTVIVEWVNVTSGYNLDVHWQESRDYLTREGYAYVGVSAQRVGVQEPPYGLTAWSPDRYGALDVTAGGTITDDSLSYDIFSQAGQAVRTNPAVLGGLRPATVLAVGQSQSASRLALYYNSIQPLAQVYDGFMLFVGSGGPFRTDIPAKLMRISTETEAVLNRTPMQPDSGVLRTWEIAGASHVDYWFMMDRMLTAARDGLKPFSFACDRQPLSHVEVKSVLNAGYQHLVNWVRHDQQPPTAQPIRTTPTPTGNVIPRDENGLAFGGIRLSEVDAPTATNDGENSGQELCRLYGSHRPFTAEKLASLYPTHDAYVRAVRSVTNRNLQQGFVLAHDAGEIVRDAEASRIGTPNPLPVP